MCLSHNAIPNQTNIELIQIKLSLHNAHAQPTESN